MSFPVYISLILLAFFVSTSVSCSSRQKDSGQNDLQEIRGEFHSLKGVKNPVSCFCYNGGYLLTAKGERIEVCLPEDLSIKNAKQITVQGHFKTFTNDAGTESPCSDSERRIFSVESFEYL